MGAPTIAEEELLVKFREKVKDVLQTEEQHEDTYLIRWLRARDLDLRKAEDMLRASLKWRAENKVDSVLDIPVDPYIKTEFPWFTEGVDKHNQPVFIFPVGKYDFRKPVSQGKIEEFKTYWTNFFEQSLVKIKEQNKGRDPSLDPITQFVSIFDWEGFAYSQLINFRAVQVMLQMGSIYEAHFPELLAKCYFINCPSCFNLVLEVIKPILAPRTLSKISVYGWEQSQWEEAMKEIMDDDQVSRVVQRIKNNKD